MFTSLLKTRGKLVVFGLLTIFLLVTVGSTAYAGAPTYSTVTVGGAQYRYVRIDLNDSNTGFFHLSANNNTAAECVKRSETTRSGN